MIRITYTRKSDSKVVTVAVENQVQANMLLDDLRPAILRDKATGIHLFSVHVLDYEPIMFHLRSNLVSNALELFREAVERGVVHDDPMGADAHLHKVYVELKGPNMMTDGEIARFSSFLVKRLDNVCRT